MAVRRRKRASPEFDISATFDSIYYAHEDNLTFLNLVPIICILIIVASYDRFLSFLSILVLR
ncbi:BnaA04g19790D [Brassica napus]|uniref:BnaA04g19790D protein n=1 Tax=Brassica napus TaxID=3708 RepID=A0A078HK63_BRANA|nr:BnaA04g19790D [Brassica napus]